jgi:hypothetical protein
MSRFRRAMKQSPAIVISLIALTFSLGSGAGYAASTVVAKGSAPKITWHALPLRNSWHAAAKGFGTGAPAYTISNSVVYLTGVASRTNQSASIPSVIGVLPKSARPRHGLWFAAYNEAAAGESSIAVLPNGDVEVYAGSTPGNQNYFTSLAGIEFPLGS